MKRILPTILLSATATVVLADEGMKPGLWEMRIVKNVVNGHDTMADMAGLNAKMAAQMEKLTLQQRAQMGAMMGQAGMGMPPGAGPTGAPGGGVGTIQMCVSAEMAKRGVPPADKDGSCQPTNVQGSAGHMTYTLNCDSRGTKITGKGESIITGDKVTTRSTSTVVDHDQTYQMQNETEFTFVKSDCGAVKPLDGSKPR